MVYLVFEDLFVNLSFFSVTALRANFWHVPGLEGPIYLDQ